MKGLARLRKNDLIEERQRVVIVEPRRRLLRLGVGRRVVDEAAWEREQASRQ